MTFRDRIQELRRVPAGELRPNPRNWRRHPTAQRDALRAVLDEVGFADALLARELADGSLELIDGHLRAETAADAEVPVLIVELDDAEADKLLAVLDPLAALAETDGAALADLMARIETESAELRGVLDGLLANSAPPSIEPPAAPEPRLEASYLVAIECASEAEQRAVFERMREEGYKCRVLTL